MGETKPTVVVTGISGNLGARLLPLLHEFDVIGVDLAPPPTDFPLRFERMDLGEEESCRQLFLLLRDSRASAVIHLAFVLDPVRTGVLDLDRIWHINVAGTARVMEAITEVNHDSTVVQKFIFTSSVSAYGPDLPDAVTEDHPLGAHTLPYAIHKMECDKVVQQRAPALRGCSAYMLRPHIFAGATVENYMVGAFRGTPGGPSPRAANMRSRGTRLPCLLPYGSRYLQNQIQFVHVDDMARLIAHMVRKTEPESQRLTVLNVAGRGEPLTFARCIELAQARLVRTPGSLAFRTILRLMWQFGLTSIPPEAAPYMTGQYIMNTDRLQKFLGDKYEDVIRYTIADAFTDCFRKAEAPQTLAQPAAEV
ncbi:MAG TPA: NAD-dependent epimerase/dehydratase family protein [Terriglobales bacterium]|jgi:nucleoside-diphosphate-sugar epimerase|nr:NAD-dependent epimerase/dehydratase family protein [Terriglobales bacterium]